LRFPVVAAVVVVVAEVVAEVAVTVVVAAVVKTGTEKVAAKKGAASRCECRVFLHLICSAEQTIWRSRLLILSVGVKKTHAPFLFC